MGNTDWWGQSAPQTAEQQAHARQAVAIERQWQAEAQAVQAERERRKQSAFQYMAVAGVSLLLGLGGFLIGAGAYQGIFFLVAFACGWRGVRQLIRSI